MDTNLETQRLMINPQPSIRVFNSINSIIDELERVLGDDSIDFKDWILQLLSSDYFEVLEENEKSEFLLVLTEKININAKDTNGLTVLHSACELKRLKAIENLLKIDNIDLKITDNHKRTVLEIFCTGTLPENSQVVANQIIEKTQKKDFPNNILLNLLNLVDNTNSEIMENIIIDLLERIYSDNIVKYVNRKLDQIINYHDSNLKTPIQTAIENKLVKVSNRLVELEIKQSLPNGRSLIGLIIRNQSIEIFNTLLKNIDIFASDKQNNNALHILAEFENNKDLFDCFFTNALEQSELKLERLINRRNKLNESPISKAIKRNNVHMVTSMINKFTQLVEIDLDDNGNRFVDLVCKAENLENFKINKHSLLSLRNSNNQNPVHVAICLKCSKEFIIELTKIFDDVKYFLEEDKHRFTALHYAVQNNNIEILEWLQNKLVKNEKYLSYVLYDLFKYVTSIECLNSLYKHLKTQSDPKFKKNVKELAKKSLSEGNFKLLDDLITFEYLDPKFLNDHTIYSFCAENNKINAYDYLIRTYQKIENPSESLENLLISNDKTILFTACKKGHIDFVKQILETNYHTSEKDIRLEIVYYGESLDEICIHKLAELIFESQEEEEKYKAIFKYIYDNYYEINLMFQRASEGRIEYFKFYFENFPGKAFLETYPELKKTRNTKDLHNEFIHHIKISKSKDKQLSVLHYSAGNLHLNLSRYLIEKFKISVNIKNSEGKTPLHYMIEKKTDDKDQDKEIEIIRYFQNNNLDLNLKDKSGNTILDSAVLFKKSRVIDFILEINAIPPEVLLNSFKNTVKMNIFDIAQQIIFYIDYEALISALKNVSDMMLLHKICSISHIERKQIDSSLNLVERLIEKIKKEDLNECLNIKDSYGYTPVFLAIKNGNYDLAELLINKYHVKLNTTGGPYKNSAIHFAAQIGDIRMLDLIKDITNLNAKNSNNENAFHLAVLFRKHDFLRKLKEILGEINLAVFTSEHMNVLHLCARESNIEGFGYILSELESSEERGQELLRLTSNNNSNILHIATENNNFEFISNFLDKKLQDLVGNESDKVAEQLVLGKNDSGKNCFHIAAAKGNRKIFSYLLQNFDKDQLLKSKDNNSNTVLHLACLHKREIIVRILLKHDLDFNEKNINFLTPFDICCKNGSMELIKLLIDQNPLNGLININKDHDNIGYPLFSVAESGNTHLLKYLIDKGANLTIKNSQNQNLLDIALANNNKDIVKCLIQNDSNLFLLNELNGKNERFKQLCKMPEMMELVLDKCIINEGGSKKYDFEILDPSFSAVDNNSVENHPLFSIAVTNERDLVTHKAVLELLEYKWSIFPKISYYLNLFLYALFLFLITYQLINHTNLKNTQNHFTNNTNNTRVYSAHNHSRLLLQTITLFFLFIHLSKEIYQLIFVNKIRYFYLLDNYIELFTFVCAFIFVFPLSSDEYYKTKLQRELAPLCGLSAWMSLALFIQKIPKFGIYGVMFKKMLGKSLWISPIFFIMLIGFSLSFYIQRMATDSLNLNTTSNELMNTLFVMVGELDNETNKLPMEHSYSRKIVFFFFVTLMCIMILNLLIGITVGEIDDIVEEADISSIAMQIKFSLRIQSDMFRIFGNELENKMLYKNFSRDKKSNDGKKRRRLISDEYIYRMKSFFKKREKLKLNKKEINERLLDQLDMISEQLEHFKFTINNKLNDLNHEISEIKSDVDSLKSKLNL